VCGLESILIMGLLAERRRRRRIQASLGDRLKLEILLSELSTEFNKLRGREIDEGIDKWVRRLGEFLGTGPARLLNVANSMAIGQRGVNESAFIIPLSVNGSKWTLAFPTPDPGRLWSADILPRLRLAGEILAGALTQKAYEEALRESQDRYRLATTAAGVLVWELELGTSKLYTDPDLCSLLEYDHQSGQTQLDDWLRLIHPDDVKFVMNQLYAHIQDGAPRFNAEHRLLRNDGTIRWFVATGTLVRDHEGRPVRVVGTNTDVTERKLAELELQHLSGRLLELQDEERRRIAWELHDGTAQNLFAIRLKLETMKQSLPAGFDETLMRCQAVCEQSLQDIRTLLNVLHPPMLDIGGLFMTLSWYLKGFSERSGVDVELIGKGSMERLPKQVEIDLFRIVQECLANVQRHSGSSTAQVRIERQDSELVLQVEDQGRGIAGYPSGAKFEFFSTSGTGLSGIRQRLRHLGGRLEIASSDQGTTITAVVPLHAKVFERAEAV
jgi:PAS domain S-box-containing protein